MPQALLALFLAAAIDDAKPVQDAGEWLALVHKTLTSSDTAQWDTAFEVLEAPAVKDQAQAFPFQVGTMRYKFRVKGENRVHWAETWEGKGRLATREAWYEGNILYVRSSKDPKKLVPIEVGEAEGHCVKRSLAEGGILGWRLAHGFDSEDPGGGYVTAMKVEAGGEEKVDGVTAIVVNVKIGFGFGPERARREAGSTRLWIDKKTLLPMKRDTTLNLGDDDRPVKLRVKETYTNWKLNEAIANETFHVEGMGPPHALVDAPKGPAAFEIAQTAKFLRFPVRDFPKPHGPEMFDELPADAPAFVFALTPRKLSGPEPKVTYEPRKSVFAKGPGGTEIEAYLGRGDDKEIAPGHGFESTPANRRHSYGGGAYHPYDVLIGKRVDGRLQPALFFRDVGSHATAPHTVAMDGKGRCHLMVADVDLGQSNRFKLYWLVGDLAAHKWTEAWLIDHRDRFTSWARPWSAAWKEHVHLIWNWDGGASDNTIQAGIYHVERTPTDFGRKTCICRDRAESVDMAVDSASGRLVVVFSTEEGVFVASKPADGAWTRPTRLHPDLTKQANVLVQAAEEGTFVIRTADRRTREWLLTIGKAKDEKPIEKMPVRTDRLGDPLPEGAVARLGSLRMTHRWDCRRVAFSPDGKILASGSNDGEIGLWEMPDGRQMHRLPGHSSSTNALAFSPDGKYLASAGNDKSARVWDVVSGKELLRLKHDGHVVAVAYAPDGKTLATASEDQTIRLWDPATGKQSRTIVTKDEKFTALAFSPDGRVLASGSWDVPTISLWDVANGNEPRRVPGHKGGIVSLTFSRDGKLLISHGWDGTILVADPARGAEVRRFGEGIQGTTFEGRIMVTAMALSPDEKVVAAGGHDDISLWDPVAGKRLRRFGPTGLVWALAFSPSGKYLASADRGKARVWDLVKGEELPFGQGHRNWLNTVAFSPDGKAIATGGDDRKVILWDAASGAPLRTLPHSQEITRVAFSPDGKLLAMASLDTTVRLWNVAKDREEKGLDGHQKSVHALAFSPEGKILAAASADGTIHLWDLATQTERRRLVGHKNWIGSLVFSKTGKELISGSVDGTVRLWEVANGNEIRRLDTAPEMVKSIAMSPDGTTVAVGLFQGKTIRLWDPATGKVIRAMEGPKDGAVSLTFARDGKILAVANPQADEVRLLDVASGKEIDRLQGHLERVFGIAISVDGTKLATASGDGTALVWDLADLRKR